MKRLLIAIIACACTHASAQKPVFNTYFDTAYWYSDTVDAYSNQVSANTGFSLDTMAGNKYGKYSQFALKFAENVYGTKVGDGLCGRVGEEMCKLSHSNMVQKKRSFNGDMTGVEVGDLIIFPQFLHYGSGDPSLYGYSNSTHLAMFMGMKSDSIMIVAHQNTEGNTYNTKVVTEEINIKAMRFFKGNNKHVPYFDVYGYEMRRTAKPEYSSLYKKGNN